MSDVETLKPLADSLDNYAFGKHVVIVVTPLAGRARGIRTFED